MDVIEGREMLGPGNANAATDRRRHHDPLLKLLMCTAPQISFCYQRIGRSSVRVLANDANGSSAKVPLLCRNLGGFTQMGQVTM